MKPYAESGKPRTPQHVTDRGAVLPSPEEIRRKCLEIQAGWDEQRERKRRAVPVVYHDFLEVAEFELPSKVDRWDYV